MVAFLALWPPSLIFFSRVHTQIHDSKNAHESTRKLTGAGTRIVVRVQGSAILLVLALGVRTRRRRFVSLWLANDLEFSRVNEGEKRLEHVLLKKTQVLGKQCLWARPKQLCLYTLGIQAEVRWYTDDLRTNNLRLNGGGKQLGHGVRTPRENKGAHAKISPSTNPENVCESWEHPLPPSLSKFRWPTLDKCSDPKPRLGKYMKPLESSVPTLRTLEK